MSATQRVVIYLDGPPPFQRWAVDRIDTSHAPTSPVMPVSVYIGSIGPQQLVAQSPQGAVNRAQLGTLELGPGDTIIVVWQPQASTNIGQVCSARLEYDTL